MYRSTSDIDFSRLTTPGFRAPIHLFYKFTCVGCFCRTTHVTVGHFSKLKIVMAFWDNTIPSLGQTDNFYECLQKGHHWSNYSEKAANINMYLLNHSFHFQITSLSFNQPCNKQTNKQTELSTWPEDPPHTQTHTPSCVWEKGFPLHFCSSASGKPHLIPNLTNGYVVLKSSFSPEILSIRGSGCMANSVEWDLFTNAKH